MNEFEERFKKLDNRKLLKVLEDADSYQPIAVEAARLELSKREVSESEIQLVRDQVSQRKAKIAKRHEKVNILEDKAKAIGTEFLETVSPIQKEPQTIDRKINVIAIVFGLLAIYMVFKELKYLFTFGLGRLDLGGGLNLILPIVLMIGTLLFWKRNKIGWILTCFIFVVNIIVAVIMLRLNWDWKSIITSIGDSSGNIQVDSIDHLNPTAFLYHIVIFVASLWVICKDDVRKEFQVDVKTVLITIGASILVIFMF